MRNGWTGSASEVSRAPSAATASARAAWSRGSHDSRQAGPGRPVPSAPASRNRCGTASASAVKNATRSPAAEAASGQWVGDLVRGVGHVHHLGGRGPVLAAELAIAQPEVQRRAHHHDQVRLPERHRPRAGDQQVVPGRQDAPRLAVRDHGQRQFLRRRPGGGLRRAEPHIGAEHQHRAAGAGQQASDHVHVGGVGGRSRRCRGAGWPGLGRLAEQGLQREVDENRSLVRGGGDAERLVHRGAHLVGPVLGPGALGDRGEQQRVVDLLQAARAPAVVRCPAGQHHHRGPVEVSRGDRADAVRHPRPAVRTARPGRRVSRAVASAANTAVCSCRTSTRRIGGSALTAPS